MTAMRELNPNDHDLIISAGDCEFWGECSCGQTLGSLRPNQSFNLFGERWDRHVNVDVPRLAALSGGAA